MSESESETEGEREDEAGEAGQDTIESDETLSPDELGLEDDDAG